MATYRSSGVNIPAGERFVSMVKPLARSTFTPDVLKDVGLFSSFVALNASELRTPVLVASTDGVGTKLSVALKANQLSTIGVDLVNHCVNDIAVSGATPLFFLDYFAMGALKPERHIDIIRGLADGCRENGIALVGGETAEMPGLYHGNDFDLAGTIVGIVEKNKIIDGKKISAGDALIGLASSGLHTNGYSLARKVLLSKYPLKKINPELGMSVAQALLAAHRSYYRAIRLLIDAVPVRGISHITGGGIVGNTKRLLPKGRSLKIDWESWERPAIFKLIQREGAVPESDMRATFNLGVGLVFVIAPKYVSKAIRLLEMLNEKPFVIGAVR